MYARGAILEHLLHLPDLCLRGITIAIAAPPTSVLVQGICDVCLDDLLMEVLCIASRHLLFH